MSVPALFRQAAVPSVSDDTGRCATETPLTPRLMKPLQYSLRRMTTRVASVAALCAVSATVRAAQVDVTVTIENLAPVNSVSFAPLRLGFGNGTFDAFNQGQSAGAAIVSIAEGGSTTGNGVCIPFGA